MTSQAVLFYAFGLFSYSAVRILVPAFYALDDTRTPVRVSMITVAGKIALNFAMMWPLKFLGLALATTAASWLNFLLLLREIRRKAGAAESSGEIPTCVRIAAASLGMGVLSLAVFRGATVIWPGSGFLAQAFRLFAAILAGAASFFPILGALKVEEGKEVLRLVGALVGKFR